MVISQCFLTRFTVALADDALSVVPDVLWPADIADTSIKSPLRNESKLIKAFPNGMCYIT